MASQGRDPGGAGRGLPRGARRRAPVPVILLVVAAVTVLGLLLGPVLTSLVIGLLRLALVLVGFALFALIGLYLWRRGDVGRFRR